MCSVFLCFFPSGNCSPSIPQNEHQSRGSGKCGKSEREEQKKSREIKSGLQLSPPVYIFPPAAYYLANKVGYVFSLVLTTSGNVSTKYITIDIHNISTSFKIHLFPIRRGSQVVVYLSYSTLLNSPGTDRDFTTAGKKRFSTETYAVLEPKRCVTFLEGRAKV